MLSFNSSWQFFCAWFDKLTTKGDEWAAMITTNVADTVSLQSTLSLMVSLSNHAQCLCRLIGDGFDLDLDVDHQPRFDCGAGWRIFRKIGGVNLVEGGEFACVLKDDECLDHV